MRRRFYHVVDRFFADAAELRSVFDRRFRDPREARSDRFVWDYWHVENQYTLVRTPAETYFPKQVFDRFQRALLEWGRENLGCSTISPPWLSYYVDGCGQELHADNPHGPWAYVFSLTPWRERKFRGGETQVLKPEILGYWKGFRADRGLEHGDLFELIQPLFNRLTVFDPRLPHGVKRVEGVRDPRLGRLVVHGWFTQPRPFIKGGLSPARATPRLNEHLAPLFDELAGAGAWSGNLVFRLHVGASGRVSKVERLTDNLVSTREESPEPDEVVKYVTSCLMSWTFPKAKGPSRITLPFYFA